jgi:23S rRNA pseudouridine2605 synthase
MSNRLIHPKYKINRIYRARINEALNERELNFLNSNKVFINEKKSQQKLTKVDTKTYIISLHVGSYHHIKRLFQIVNKKIIKLTRIEFAGITHVGSLSQGEYRLLKSKEIK